MSLSVFLSLLFLSFSSFGQAVDHEVHCNTKLLEVKNSFNGKFFADGNQHQILSYHMFPSQSVDILSLKDSLNIYKKNDQWYSYDGRPFYGILPVFTKDQAFQSYVVFENNVLPKSSYEAGRYIILSKRTQKYNGQWSYYIRAVAYRDSTPVLTTQLSLSGEKSYQGSYTHTPQFAHLIQERDLLISQHQLRYDKGEISREEFMKLRAEEFKKAYKTHGVGNLSTLWLDCELR
jgi:hypothetical protein